MIVPGTGLVGTVAGVAFLPGSSDGPGLSATFNGPTGLAYEAATDTLYISDTNNDTVRALALSTDVVSTLTGTAGTPGSTDGSLAAAQFNGPIGLAFDGSNKLFVADSDNETIRQIDLQAGVVSTLAGSAGVSGVTDGFGAGALFATPYGLTIDASSVFVTDASNDTLRRLDLSSNQVTTVAGSGGSAGSVDGIDGASRFSFPTGAAFDVKNGNVYIADRDSSAIRSYSTSTQSVTTVAGKAPAPGGSDGLGMAAQFIGPTGVTYDSISGVLYVADMINQLIRTIDSSGNVVTLAGTQGGVGSNDGQGGNARFNGPLGLALDNSGDLFVADVNNDTIRFVATSNGTVATYAGAAGSVGADDGFRTNARFNGASGVAFDGVSAIYITDTNNDTIRKIDLNTQTVSTVAGHVGSTGWIDGSGTNVFFNHPTGIAYDGSQYFYITDTGNSLVRRMDAAGNVTTIAGSGLPGAKNAVGLKASFNQPRAITYAVLAGTTPTSVLLVSDTGNSLIREIKLATGRVTTWLGKAGQAGVIAKTPTTPPGVGSAPAGLNQPVGLAFSATNGLYIADEAENVILLAH